MAFCLADGTIFFTDLSTDKPSERVIWCAQLHIRGELFGLSKFNLTKDDGEETCVCAWDGTTYVFTHRKQLFRFPLGQSCQAFTGGHFAIRPGQNEPVFVYATFDRSLLIYYNLDVDHVALPTLSHAIQSNETIVKQLECIQIDPQNQLELQKTIQFLLYELPKLEGKLV